LPSSWAEIAADLGVARSAGDPRPVFSPLGRARHGDAVETIYEGYLAHYGRPRSFRLAGADEALLVGDSLYAAGLAAVAASGDVAAVGDLAELLGRCAELRGLGRAGDGELWALTVALLGTHPLLDGADPGRRAREAAGAGAVDRALAAHAARFG
jgi:hypothetical protein